MDNSSVLKNFGVQKDNTDKDNNQNSNSVSTPVEGSVNNSTVVESDDILNAPYTDKRSVTISLVRNYNLFREANRTSLPAKVDYIGSSVSSSQILSSSKGEIEAYFPQIIGLSINNPEFVTRVKQYLNNIQIRVDALGKTFNTSFRYNHKSDYYKIIKEEEKIESNYNKADKRGLKNLKAAIKEKIDALNTLESTKYLYGFPEQVEDYIMYRHCLLYNDIAKDVALINSNPSIRFYFKDDKKEADRLRRRRNQINKAKSNYVAALADDALFDALYIQYALKSNLPVAAAINKSRLDKEIDLDNFSNNNPEIFNDWFNDKNIKLKSEIELMIVRGILIRSQYNQNITSIEGTFVGANIGEAVAWFNDVNNSSEITALKNRLKNI